MKSTRTYLDVRILIGSLIAGILAWAADMGIYHVLEGMIHQSILIGIMFMILALFVSAAVLIISIAEGQFDEEFFFLQSKGAIVVGLAVMIAGMFLLSSLFDWIYSYEFEKGPSSFIFVIDESGSMEESDPELLRYQAVAEMMEEQETVPFAIYCFGETAARYREMGSYEPDELQEWQNWEVNEGGGTALKFALETVLHDLETKELDGGEAPRLVVLSDGYAQDIIANWVPRKLVHGLRDEGASVSTVGLGEFDQTLLETIADKTGGVSVNAEEASSLAESIRDAAFRNERNLLSRRKMPAHNGLYGFMRVLFLTLLGVWLSVMKTMACSRTGEEWKTILTGAMLGLAGAAGFEFIVNALPASLCVLLLWLLLSVLIVMSTMTVGEGMDIGGFSQNNFQNQNKQHTIQFH